MTPPYNKYIHEDIKSKLISDNSCYQSVLKLFSSLLPLPSKSCITKSDLNIHLPNYFSKIVSNTEQG